MRFLAHESCDIAVVRALRAAGHDVVAVAEIARGTKDVEVLALAREGADVMLLDYAFQNCYRSVHGSPQGIR